MGYKFLTDLCLLAHSYRY